jgi:hypothetical protein
MSEGRQGVLFKVFGGLRESLKNFGNLRTFVAFFEVRQNLRRPPLFPKEDVAVLGRGFLTKSVFSFTTRPSVVIEVGHITRGRTMTLKAICGYAGVFLAIAGVALLVAQMIVGGIDLVFDTNPIYRTSFQTSIVGFGLTALGLILVMVSAIGQKTAYQPQSREN